MRTELDRDQQEFLDERLRKLSLVQPGILQLRDRLLGIGGCHLVAPSRPEPDLDLLLEEGCIAEGEVEFEEMVRNSCHWNTASIWKRRSVRITGIGTGYALSDDGLWRQHSWCFTADGILETTEMRHTYYGIRLEGAKADRFSEGYDG
jgi:hypothetical protein